MGFQLRDKGCGAALEVAGCGRRYPSDTVVILSWAEKCLALAFGRDHVRLCVGEGTA